MKDRDIRHSLTRKIGRDFLWWRELTLGAWLQPSRFGRPQARLTLARPGVEPYRNSPVRRCAWKPPPGAAGRSTLKSLAHGLRSRAELLSNASTQGGYGRTLSSRSPLSCSPEC